MGGERKILENSGKFWQGLAKILLDFFNPVGPPGIRVRFLSFYPQKLFDNGSKCLYNRNSNKGGTTWHIFHRYKTLALHNQTA